ncbi:hypothetical protein GXW74_20625 [Roseomonas eburnea]|uniref:Sigma-70 family RNA polymerase sigma factor n=1 Tax=Neoroseomonas eburnea TaxID=1346889 RepID=A0A9X9XGS3_9PROT|nr:hypothetical protein [Neoroseomonas eburnea]MBR0682909.1 hypothetical protein [Neoroseomonas eburnea]
MQTSDLRRSDPVARFGAETPVRAILAADFEVIRRWVLRRCDGDAQAAGEIMAAFCLRALARAPQLRDTAAARGWLAAVLRSTIADHRRSERMERRRYRSDDPLSLAQRSEYAVPPPADPARGDPCACLREVLAALRPEERDLLQAIDLRSEDRAVHAARLGLTRNALGVRLHRARAALRAAMLAHCDACSDDGRFDPWICPSPALPDV